MSRDHLCRLQLVKGAYVKAGGYRQQVQACLLREWEKNNFETARLGNRTIDPSRINVYIFHFDKEVLIKCVFWSFSIKFKIILKIIEMKNIKLLGGSPNFSIGSWNVCSVVRFESRVHLPFHLYSYRTRPREHLNTITRTKSRWKIWRNSRL